MSKLFESLKRALKEAIAHEKGETELRTEIVDSDFGTYQGRKVIRVYMGIDGKAVELYRLIHARWEDLGDDVYRCSHCHRSPIVNLDNDWVLSSYCPNCGAQMGLEE